MNKSKNELIPSVPSGWEAKELCSICGLVRNIYMPSSDDSQPYIGLEHIGQGTLNLVDIGKASDVTSAKFAFKKGQVLFGKLRPYFRKLYRPTFDGVCSTDIFVIDGKNANDNGFIFYFFANQEIIEEATRSSEGTRMPRASWEYLSKLIRPIPPLQEQKVIAKVLSDIDAKIELNHKMNKALESIGQTLYKHWFVDFEFPNEKGKPYKSSGGKMVDSELGEIPDGWHVGQLNDVITVKGGTTPSTAVNAYWEGGNNCWCTPKDLSLNDSLILFDTERKITNEGLGAISSGLLPVGTLLLSSRAPIGYIAIAETPTAINQGFIAILCDKCLSNLFMLFWTRQNLDEIKSMANGSTFQEINKTSFRKIPIIIPSNKVLQNYDLVSKCLYDKIVVNQKGIIDLQATRDSLLPRLMSGKIRVEVK